MVFINGGTFMKGDAFGDGWSNERPLQEVTLSDYYIGRYEVTYEEFDTFCNATIRDLKPDLDRGRGKRPIIFVSWFDAVTYCNWLSQEHGFTPVYTIDDEEVTANWKADGYRLPTEAEWEFAARSRGRKDKWAGTSDENELKLYANIQGNEDGYDHPAPVGSFKPNDLGLYDMTGNVSEWCWDWQGKDRYAKKDRQIEAPKAVTDPKGPDTWYNVPYRLVRGGAASYGNKYLRCTQRGGTNPESATFAIGFRLARSAW
ncbi:MAG: SUMF1/EgtB/PvdO family nonheme iron enzyme [Saprospiraceae bacterium]